MKEVVDPEWMWELYWDIEPSGNKVFILLEVIHLKYKK